MEGTVKREVTVEEMTKAVAAVGYTYLDSRDLSKHPGDWYLKVVKAVRESDKEYVVWLYNATFEGLAEGYYTHNKEVADIKFDNKK